jgi:hypothetical protein
VAISSFVPASRVYFVGLRPSRNDGEKLIYRIEIK